jgi:hypothetical protein
LATHRADLDELSTTSGATSIFSPNSRTEKTIATPDKMRYASKQGRKRTGKFLNIGRVIIYIGGHRDGMNSTLLDIDVCAVLELATCSETG